MLVVFKQDQVMFELKINLVFFKRMTKVNVEFLHSLSWLFSINVFSKEWLKSASRLFISRSDFHNKYNMIWSLHSSPFHASLSTSFSNSGLRAVHVLWTEWDCVALILLARWPSITPTAGARVKNQSAPGVGLIGESCVRPIVAVIVAQIEAFLLAAHGDDIAVGGDSDQGQQSNQSGHGDLHCKGLKVFTLLTVVGSWLAMQMQLKMLIAGVVFDNMMID